MIKIVLEDYRGLNSIVGNDFKVIKMHNTIQFRIGDYLSETVVKDLARFNTYEIVIQARKERA